MSTTMTTATNVVAELQARGLETRPLSGREFPVPSDVAADVAYRWRLLSIGACRRILRAAFPHEPANMIDHWAGNADIAKFTGELGETIRQAVSRAVCADQSTVTTDAIDELVLARRLRLTLAGAPAQPVRAPRPLEYVRPSKRAVRTAERQEEIDVLELANMGRMFA